MPNFFENIGIESIFIRLGNNVPGLSRSFVTVVQGVEPQILNVPAK